jgi:hypothetical protein
MAKLTIKNNYATIPNSFINRDDISLKAKGLFAYLQSKPNEWKFSKERIALQLKEGLASIKSAFAELKKAGYLKTIPQKDSRGKFVGWDYILDDNPTVGKTVGTEIGLTENHTDISKKELSKKELRKKELDISENKFSQDIATIMELFSTINPSIQYGNKTQRKACEDMIKRFGSSNVINMVNQVILVQGEKYAPVATTPYIMYKKLGDFKIYFEKQRTVNGELLDLS